MIPNHLVLCLLASAAMAEDTDIFMFGLSKHFNYQPKEQRCERSRNPGCGVGMMFPLTESVEVGGGAGWYVDSYGEIAKFAMPTIRWYYDSRICLDASAGYFQGSTFDGIGFVPTLGLRVYKNVWIHGTYGPRGLLEGMDLVAFYVRIRL